MTLNFRQISAAVAFSVLFTVIGVAASEAQQTPGPQPSTETLIAMARNTAAIDGRTVMLRFRASWCDWCALLESALHSYELGRIFAANYVFVSLTVQESEDKLDLETPGAGELMDELGGSGIPFFAFIDAGGRWLANSMVMPGGGNIGYPVTAEEIAAFEALIERTAPRMSEEDRARVVAYLVERASTL